MALLISLIWLVLVTPVWHRESFPWSWGHSGPFTVIVFFPPIAWIWLGGLP